MRAVIAAAVIVLASGVARADDNALVEMPGCEPGTLAGKRIDLRQVDPSIKATIAGIAGDISAAEAGQTSQRLGEFLHRWRCDAPAAVTQPQREYVAKIDGIVTKTIAVLDAVVAKEAQCQATPACMAARELAVATASSVEDVCTLIERRKSDVKRMAAERSNPSGVVSLSRLHELGEDIQYCDHGIASSKADYTAIAHKPFTMSLCVGK